MNPYIFTYIMFFLQGVLESYFLSNYLYSENKNKAYLLSQIILCFFQHPVQMILFELQGIKMIFFIASLYMVVFICFPKNSLKKKLFSVVLLMLLISFIEIIAIFIEVITIGMPDSLSLGSPHPMHVYLMQLIVMYIVFTISLKFINKQILLSKVDMGILLFMSILQFSFLYLLNVNITMDLVGVSMKVSKTIYSILLFISLSSYFVIIVYLYKKQRKKNKELMMLMLQKEYEQQLNHYMYQKDSRADLGMIRHDLINYIQNQKEL